MEDVSNPKKVVVPDRVRSRALSCVAVKSEFKFDEDDAFPFSDSIAWSGDRRATRSRH